MIASRRNWTEDELFIALSLYRLLPFGQFHGSNPRIIECAGAMGRVPNSVGMKLSNFAGLDDGLNRTGLKRASKLDKEVWKKARAMSAAEFASRVELAMESLAEAGELQAPEDAGGERETKGMARIGQAFFRHALMVAYQGRCCISGISNERMLDACHIKPWSSTGRRQRVSVSNGLLLDPRNHRAFDLGIISIHKQGFFVMVSKDADDCFKPLDGILARKPVGTQPCPKLLEWHNDEVFMG